MRNALTRQLRNTVALLSITCLLVPPAAPALAQAGRAGASQPADAEPSEAAWPRVIEDAERSITVYQPQIGRWQDDTLEARAAVAVDKPGTQAQTLGVVWFKAHTAVDRESDSVALDTIEVVKTSFPSDLANADAYATALRQHAGEGLRTISLARLQTSLAVAEAETATKTLPVKNDPPKIIFSETPAASVTFNLAKAGSEVMESRDLLTIHVRSLPLGSTQHLAELGSIR